MKHIRLAFRQLLTRPGFAAVALATLALGIGANSAVFAVVNAVLLDPLPYTDPSRVVALFEQTPAFPSLSVTRYNYDDWRTMSQSFAAMGAYRATSMTLTGGRDPERIPAKMITASLLPLLGARVAIGRPFGDADDRPGAENVVLLGAAFRERRFGAADPIGQSLVLDNRPYVIVGVLPARFELFAPADVFVPFGPWAATLPNDRGWHPGIVPLARLKDTISIDAARTEMSAIAARLATAHPESNTNVTVLVNRVGDQLVQNVRPALLVLLGAVALVLLIACANVANLLLARAVDRQKEIAVRTALGAGRRQLLVQLVTESLVLACLGGAAGLLVGWWGVSFLTQTVVTGLPRAQAIGMAWPVVLFTSVLSVVTGGVFGLVPALQASRVDLRDALNQDGRGSGAAGPRHRRLRSALVVTEIALALVLLVSASLLLRSFVALTSHSPGFDPRNLLVVDLPLSPLTYRENAARTIAVERIVEQVRALPGVASAGTTTMLPMSGAASTIHFNRIGRPPASPSEYLMAGFRAVSPDYLSTLGVPLVRGRLLAAADREGAARVVVINESMARLCYPNSEALGQRIQLGTEPSPGAPDMEVVGIIGDMKQSFDAGAKAEMFVPYAQYPPAILAGLYRNTFLVVRTAGEPETMAGAIREVMKGIDPNQPLVNVRTMDRAISNTVAQPRLQMVLISIFAAVAGLLAVVGVYGVMAYAVSQRTQEIGVRLALGASPSGVVSMIVWEGARLAILGLAIGLAGAAMAAGTLGQWLANVQVWDGLAFAVATVMLAIAAIAASLIPARRAARVPPATALGR